MEGKLQELTNRIYMEGVERARQTAEGILTEARQEAQRITAEAKAAARRTREQADEAAEKLRTNTLAEVQLAARQATADLRQRIADLVLTELLQAPLEATVSDQAFLQSIIETAMRNWQPAAATPPDLRLLLPERERAALDTFVEQRTQALLQRGIHIDYDARLNDGFRIGPADGSYKVSFSAADFEQFFRMYLRPQVDCLLFES